MSTGKSVTLRHKLENLDVQTSPSVIEYGGDWSFRYEKSSDRLFLLYNRHTDSGTWAVHIQSASVKLTWPDDSSKTYDSGLNDCLLTRNKMEARCKPEELWSLGEKFVGTSVEIVINVQGIYENTLETFTISIDYNRRANGSFESDYYGVSWTCNLSNHDNYVKLTCNETTQSTLWSILAHTELICNYDDPEKMETKEVVNAYSRCSDNVRMIGRFYKKINNRTLKMKLVVVVLKLSGLRKTKRLDFEKEDGEMTDVCFVVEGKKFFVNKTILALHSPVFRAMFFGNFSETSSKEVVFDDVDIRVFEMFISIIYSKECTINGSEASGLLQLADRYDVDKVIKKVEEFLMNDKYAMSATKKLKLAEQYNLGALHHKVVSSLDKTTLRELRKNIEEFNSATVTALLDKSMDLW